MPLGVRPPRTPSIWVACGALLVWRLRRLDGQKLLCGLSEYCDALGIAQPRSIENVVNRGLGPWEGIIGAHHDLARPDFGDAGTGPTARTPTKITDPATHSSRQFRPRAAKSRRTSHQIPIDRHCRRRILPR